MGRKAMVFFILCLLTGCTSFPNASQRILSNTIPSQLNPEILPTQNPLPIQNTVMVDPTPTFADSTPTPSPSPSKIPDPPMYQSDSSTAQAKYADVLQYLALFPGTSWTYLLDSYSGKVTDPNDSNASVTLIHRRTRVVDTVVEVEQQPPYMSVQIERVPKDLNPELGPPDDFSNYFDLSSFWYILDGADVYRSKYQPDFSHLQTDEWIKELFIPLMDGSSWCPYRGEESPSRSGAATLEPCLSGGLRFVNAKPSRPNNSNLKNEFWTGLAGEKGRGDIRPKVCMDAGASLNVQITTLNGQPACASPKTDTFNSNWV